VVLLLNIELIGVVLARIKLAICFTPGRRLLLRNGAESVLEAHLLHWLRSSLVHEGLLLLARATHRAILQGPAIFGSHWVLEGDTCRKHFFIWLPIFLFYDFLRLLIDTLVEIVPEFVLFSFFDPHFYWNKLRLLMLRGD
jgi:hypothetical protein